MTAPVPIGAAVLVPDLGVLRGPGGDARLTPQPLRLLMCMAGLAPRVVPYAEAVACMGDRYGRGDAGTVHSHLQAVRRALRDSGSGAVADTVVGLGVRLRVPAREAGVPPREAA